MWCFLDTRTSIKHCIPLLNRKRMFKAKCATEGHVGSVREACCGTFKERAAVR